MKNRKEIELEIKAHTDEINRLRGEVISLQKEALLLCDDEQWFTENTEEKIVSKRPKKVVSVLVGRIHWKEDFKDQDTDDVITIERSQVVRIDGQWVV